jgi:uncharacterized protein (DUF1786 family)
MTNQTKTVLQVTYTLQGSFGAGYRVERTESAALTIHERLACLFADIKTMHKALVGAAIEAGRLTPEQAAVDANTVILQLVARTLQRGGDSAQLESEVCEDLEPLMH